MLKIENLIAAVFDTHVWVWSAAGDLRAEKIQGFSGTAIISAISYLAAVDSESRLAGSAEIAGSREISRTLIAKILAILSRAGLVAGTPGPSGGYRLARPAAEISLLDVVRVSRTSTIG